MEVSKQVKQRLELLPDGGHAQELVIQLSACLGPLLAHGGDVKQVGVAVSDGAATQRPNTVPVATAE